MNHETLAMLRARAITIREILDDRKISPDQMTAAALLYLALKIMKLDADNLIESLPDSIRSLTRSFTPDSIDDPNGTITLTNTELVSLIHSKIGRA